MSLAFFAGLISGWLSLGTVVGLFIGLVVRIADAQDAVDLDPEPKVERIGPPREWLL